MLLYLYDPEAVSTFTEQSRTIGRITSSVVRFLEDRSFHRTISDQGHKSCEYHFSNAANVRVNIRTELTRDPLHASVELNGDSAQVQAFETAIASHVAEVLRGNDDGLSTTFNPVAELVGRRPVVHRQAEQNEEQA